MNLTQLRALYRLWARQETRAQTFRIEKDGYTHT